MASVCCDPGDYKRVTWMDPQDERRVVRLGKCDKKNAEFVARKVEAVVASQITGLAMDAETAKWVSQLSDVLHCRFAKQGLFPARVDKAATTLERMLADFFAELDVKPASRVRMEQARRALLGHFTGDRDVRAISEADAAGWRNQMKSDKYAQATISRSVLYARQFFRWGLRRGLVSSNPFAELKAGTQVNKSRQVFIDAATIAKVIDAAPDVEWRLLIALSRFGGLRVPSEALALRWSDVDWANGRLTIRSCKTEHHEGGGERIIPLFPEIRAHLLPAFEAAADGAV